MTDGVGETPEESCKHALKHAKTRLGREDFSASEYDTLNISPSSSTIQRVMGGWNEAKQAVGFDTHAGNGDSERVFSSGTYEDWELARAFHTVRERAGVDRLFWSDYEREREPGMPSGETLVRRVNGEGWQAVREEFRNPKD
jgi:hypothetical protein